MRQFEVYRGGVKLGRISLDMPSAGGRLEPAPSFESVRHLFEAEARCLDTASDPDISDDEKAHAWALADEAHEAIMGPGIRIDANDIVRLSA